MKAVICAVLLVAACGGGNSGGGGGGDDDPTQPDAGTTGGAACGDAIVDDTEECDDGNTASDDGCAADCTLEASGGACSPYSFRCNPAGDVETCNNAGTAWLVVENCATGCAGGVCTDATCTPGATRCHGNAVEVCDGGGTSWSSPTACPTYCAAGQCALQALDVTTNSNYTGTVIVAGDFTVGGNSTLTAEDGDLTIIAENITIAQGAAIAVAPTGENTKGQSCVYSYYGRQANYGQVPTSYMVAAYGSEDDADVEPGSIGGRQSSYACSYPNSPITGYGGGVIRLIARKNVTIAGQILAAGQNGTPYGGSGGGVQIAGDTITITGSISTAGGNSSGYGRVRLLYGSTLTNTGTIIGTITEGRRPPLELTSPTHPNPTLYYNDNFEKLVVAHERPFTTAQGYLHTIDTSEFAPPQPAEGVFAGLETFDIEAAKLEAGDNWVHLASLDASSALGAVESRFKVNINAEAPYAESTSHTSPTTWYTNANPYFAWTNPGDIPDASFPKVRYVLDHFGDTIPTKTDTALPISQKQLLVSNLAAGIWVFHVLTEDTVGNLTKKAAHVVVRVGADPGTGTVFGSVFNAQNQPVSGAKVRVNRGLFTATTNSSGSYTISGVAAGAWEISVQAATGTAAPQQLTVNKDGQASANFTLN